MKRLLAALVFVLLPLVALAQMAGGIMESQAHNASAITSGVLSPVNGGTGVANTATNTITLGGPFVTSEGTWTPVLNAATTATYTTQTARYTRIGRKIFVEAILTINLAGNGDQTSIGGLPFAVAATDMGGCSIGQFSGLATLIVFIAGYPVGGTTRIQFQSLTIAAVATGGSNLFGNAASIKFSCSFTV